MLEDHPRPGKHQLYVVDDEAQAKVRLVVTLVVGKAGGKFGRKIKRKIGILSRKEN